MSIEYNRTNWTNGETPLNASNMNNIETGVVQLVSQVNTNESNIISLQSSESSIMTELEGLSTNVQTLNSTTNNIENRLISVERATAQQATEFSVTDGASLFFTLDGQNLKPSSAVQIITNGSKKEYKFSGEIPERTGNTMALVISEPNPSQHTSYSNLDILSSYNGYYYVNSTINPYTLQVSYSTKGEIVAAAPTTGIITSGSEFVGNFVPIDLGTSDSCYLNLQFSCFDF